MGDNSSIEWTEATWNPVAGCSILSPGCTNCYAMKMAGRIEAMDAALGHAPHYRGLTQKTKAGAVWTGKMSVASNLTVTQPLRWKRPRRIFVNSMSDLFHEGVADETIDRIFAVMALCPQHTFQVLTKRAKRMREYFAERWQGTPARDIRMPDGKVLHVPRGGETGRRHQVEEALRAIADKRGMIDPDIDEQWDEKGRLKIARFDWPLPNVWLGVSTEDQVRADERIPHLLATPAAKRFISAEPLLGAIDLHETWLPCPACKGRGWYLARFADNHPSPCKACIKAAAAVGVAVPEGAMAKPGTRLDWVIAGGESGPRARPMHPDWARSLRDQCAAAGVPFFFKQWGEWGPDWEGAATCAGCDSQKFDTVTKNGECSHCGKTDWLRAKKPLESLARVGKKAAGAELDGKLHREFPT